MKTTLGRHWSDVWVVVVACVMVAITAPEARAQEAMYTEAATMPSPGTGVVRPDMHYERYGLNPNSGETKAEEYELNTRISYGIVRDWAIQLDVPLLLEREEQADGTGDSDRGVGDLHATVKWRFYKADTGGIDTLRAALLGGASFASGDDEDFSSESINPHLGVVVTKVSGRWGFNQDLLYRWNTGGTIENNRGGEGPDDALMFSTAAVYRLWPDRFTSESIGAWYATGEINGLYETNGDLELRWSPGLMYEGRTWGFDVMAQFPLFEDVQERPALAFAIGFGFRFSF
jgi:hypothetical protein